MTIHAKITAINPSTREVTLQGRSGNSVTVTAGPVVRLDMLKVGDTVNAQYYRSVAFELSTPRGGDQAPRSNDAVVQVTEQQAQAPGGIGVRLDQLPDWAAHIAAFLPGLYAVDALDAAFGAGQ